MKRLTEAVAPMRDEHLAGCGDVDLSTQNSFNDQILDLAHEH